MAYLRPAVEVFYVGYSLAGVVPDYNPLLGLNSSVFLPYVLCHQSYKDQSDKDSRSLKSSKASSCLTGPYGKPGTLLLFSFPILSLSPSYCDQAKEFPTPLKSNGMITISVAVPAILSESLYLLTDRKASKPFLYFIGKANRRRPISA